VLQRRAGVSSSVSTPRWPPVLIAVVAAACGTLPSTDNPSPAARAADSPAVPSSLAVPSTVPGASPTPAVPATPAPAAPTGAPSAAGTAGLTGLAPLGPTERAEVVRVVDGDTIVVDRGRGDERVRYIGVDTPESVDPRRPVEWMGREAAVANRLLVEGREVVLESDITDRDQYDRLLRYVWLRDGDAWSLVNLELVRLGFAQVVTYPPDVRYVDLYLVAQAEAREAERGLWGPEEGPLPSGESSPAPSGDCAPAYPSVCIPPAPPDLDCGDIPFRRFEVLAPDPHRFDGNADGVGCERD